MTDPTTSATPEPEAPSGGVTGDPVQGKAAPPTSSKRGCVLVFALFASLGVGSLVLSKFLFERKNANILEGARALAHVIDEASAAPGAASVRSLGCETAGVLSTDALRGLAQHLEEEAARNDKRAPREIDLGAREPVVFCAHPATGEPSCAKVVAAYLRDARPDAPFVVTVRTGFRETCAERFDPSGRSLGPAPSPKLPLLVAPR